MRSRGNKTHCFPLDQSLSVCYTSQLKNRKKCEEIVCLVPADRQICHGFKDSLSYLYGLLTEPIHSALDPNLRTIFQSNVSSVFSMTQPHDVVFEGGWGAVLEEQRRGKNEINNDTRKGANQDTKMRTYRLFKTIDNYKDYLHQVNNTRHRIALTKLRLSNHKLAIETGHYSRPLKKPAERTCPICKLEMEDEYHFICKYMPCLPGQTMFVTRLFGKRIWNKNKQNVI